MSSNPARPAVLSASFVRTVNQPGRYGDGRGGHGLSVLVRPTRNGRWSKTWSQRLRVNGKPIMIGLGAYPIVTLAEARAKCLENRRAVERGRDPRGDGVPSFAQAAERVIALHARQWKPGSRSEQQWRTSLETYVFPQLGAKRVDLVTVGDILAVLADPWTTRSETARRLAQRISTILKWAMGAGHRTDDPTAAAVAALPRHTDKPQHHRALHHSEVAAALEKIRTSKASTSAKLGLEFLTLTAARSGEVRGAEWSEFDIDGAVWTIPPERTKTRTAHREPLSDRALEVLAESRSVSSGEGLAFPSPTTGRALTNESFPKLMRELAIDGTPHGMRAAFRSWCSDTAVPRDLAEMCLGHAVKGVEGAYQRSDMLDRRRPLMEAWSQHVQLDELLSLRRREGWGSWSSRRDPQGIHDLVARAVATKRCDSEPPASRRDS